MASSNHHDHRTTGEMAFLGMSLAWTLFVAACGGGSGVDQQKAGFPNPGLYTGTWYSDCSDHMQSTVTISGAGGALTLNARDAVYAAADCTGSVIATETLMVDPTVVYLSTLDSLVQLAPTGAASSIKLDRISVSSPQNQRLVTGAAVYDKAEAGIPRRCVDYLNGSTCWSTAVMPAGMHDAGIYASGAVLYSLSVSSAGVFSVDAILRKTR